MRLIAARLERVRQHLELELSFAPGLTLIGGPNEAGKSTIVEALHKALFLKATATGRGIEELRSLTHGGLPQVELRFEAGGQTWQLRKRFAGAGGTCQLSSDGGSTLQGSSAEAQLAALLQVPGPVEGRRIAQLPLRWAHLWVRQGDAGTDPLAAGPEAHDLGLLVQQLQQAGSAAALQATASALESPLDRQVQQQLQQRLELQLTATGKVRAGSPLALALAREAEARSALQQGQARLAELEAALEQLRQIAERLTAIEAQSAQLHRLGRLQADAQPLQQQHLHLQSAQRQWQALQQQQRADQGQLAQLQQQLEHLHQQRQQRERAAADGSRQRQGLEQRSQELLRQQNLLSALADLASLEREQEQLRQHKAHFDGLQQQATAIKQQLQQLPAIGSSEVRQLRQAEQQLVQAQARCQGMATQVALLEGTAAISLDGQPLMPGESRLLEQPAVVAIDGDTRLLISPGGGAAMGDAVAARHQAQTQLQALQQQLGQPSSEAAETLAQQRQALESELTNLRKAAATIPWAQLDAQLAALQPRRQRLQGALAELGQASDAPPPSPSDLDGRQQTLKQDLQALGQQRTQLERELADRQQQREHLDQVQAQHQAEAGRLAGALAATDQQLQELQRQHGDPQQLDRALTALDSQLQARQGQIEALQQQLGAAASDSEQRLRQLEADKENLLTNRGQQEQICRSLGAREPALEVEQQQAELEQAQAERQALERSTGALQLLLQAFAEAQQQSASHYCLPLQAALQGYLDALGLDPGTSAPLRFAPQQGFSALQLQRQQQRFDFGQLSGGMREQLAAALRLALAELLLGAYDGCLPLVLDDAFSNSDPQRQAGVLRMLQRGVRQGVQVLLFSCTPAAFEPLAARLGSCVTLGSAVDEKV
jgi:DNA repair exonuclease SbcCD ATPase subunit